MVTNMMAVRRVAGFGLSMSRFLLFSERDRNFLSFSASLARANRVTAVARVPLITTSQLSEAALGIIVADRPGMAAGIFGLMTKPDPITRDS
jgi:hypothetical protein